MRAMRAISVRTSFDFVRFIAESTVLLASWAGPVPVLRNPLTTLAQTIRIDEHRDLARQAALRIPWDALRQRVAAAGAPAGPFLSYDWAAVTEQQLGWQLGQPRILLAWRGARLVGVLPLVREQRRLARLPARVLRSLSDDHSQRWDALIEDEQVAAAFIARLLRTPDWDALELRDGLDAVGSVKRTGAEMLVDAARSAGCHVGLWPSQRSPYLELPALTAELDAALPAKFRANLRRRARLLAAEFGPLNLEFADESALDEALRLESQGWKGRAGTAIGCDAALTERYRALAVAFAASGQLALSFLRAGARRVSAHFALLEQGIYYLFKIGSDPSLARYGLGHLHVHAIAHHLIQSGARALDFLGDTAEWKRVWTLHEQSHHWRYVFSPTLYGRSLGLWKLKAAPTLARFAQELRA